MEETLEVKHYTQQKEYFLSNASGLDLASYRIIRQIMKRNLDDKSGESQDDIEAASFLMLT